MKDKLYTGNFFHTPRIHIKQNTNFWLTNANVQAQIIVMILSIFTEYWNDKYTIYENIEENDPNKDGKYW